MWRQARISPTTIKEQNPKKTKESKNREWEGKTSNDYITRLTLQWIWFYWTHFGRSMRYSTAWWLFGSALCRRSLSVSRRRHLQCTWTWRHLLESNINEIRIDDKGDTLKVYWEGRKGIKIKFFPFLAFRHSLRASRQRSSVRYALPAVPQQIKLTSNRV